MAPENLRRGAAGGATSEFHTQIILRHGLTRLFFKKDTAGAAHWPQVRRLRSHRHPHRCGLNMQRDILKYRHGSFAIVLTKP